MKMQIEKILNTLENNATKIYLVSANLILVIFGIWFSNAGLLPFFDTSDFLVFAILATILALYRPSWTFAFFVGTLALENINLAPKNLSLAIRPYQFFGLLTMVALLVQTLLGRLHFSFPKWKWYDAMPIIFAAAGFLSAMGAVNRAATLKQAIVAFSFAAFYYLARIYLQSLSDLKRIAPFFLSSALVVVFYGIWQNIRFLHGVNAFEVMPGRPNATFTEPDWYGIYLVFVLAVLFAIIYALSKKVKKNTEFFIAQCLSYVFLSLIFTALLLTVSRSAWLGALLVVIAFGKVMLMDGSLRISRWQWKKFLLSCAFVIIALGVSAGFATMLTRFQISNRAQSTGGLQKITIACQSNHGTIPQTIGSVDELVQYGCRHINLEDIASEKAQGNDVLEIFRTDPTVNIRAQIYQKSIAQIKAHPFLGIGWGSIGQILGTDERGAGLNASNIFLEIYLGGGLLGFVSFVALLVGILFFATKAYLCNKKSDKTKQAIVLFGWIAIVFPNLFNSGIFLGFVWVFLAISAGLLTATE